MLFRRLIIVLILMFGLQPSVTAGEALSFFPELAEWGAAGGTFYLARRLDHQPARNSRTIFNQAINKPFRENTVSSSQLYAVAGNARASAIIPMMNGLMRINSFPPGIRQLLLPSPATARYMYWIISAAARKHFSGCMWPAVMGWRLMWVIRALRTTATFYQM